MIKDIDTFQKQFYSVQRLGLGLNGGGGPFNFDIHKAYDFCTVIDHNNIDVIVETGCNAGDTTEFLAIRYPDKKIITCDIDYSYVNLAKIRLQKYNNVDVHEVSSEYLIKQVNHKSNIIFYLDAHWGNYHPLKDELNNIDKGYIMVDDFDIGCANFQFDTYESKIDIDLVKHYTNEAYINNPAFKYPIFCHQITRKAGRCFFQKQKDSKVFKFNNFKKILDNQHTSATIV